MEIILLNQRVKQLSFNASLFREEYLGILLFVLISINPYFVVFYLVLILFVRCKGNTFIMDGRQKKDAVNEYSTPTNFSDCVMSGFTTNCLVVIPLQHIHPILNLEYDIICS